MRTEFVPSRVFYIVINKIDNLQTKGQACERSQSYVSRIILTNESLFPVMSYVRSRVIFMKKKFFSLFSHLNVSLLQIHFILMEK